MKSNIFKLLVVLLFVNVLSLTADSPDFSRRQLYLFEPPVGIGASSVWHLPGGKGENVKIVDVEQGWIVNHEDLPSPGQLLNGSNLISHQHHGASVLGILVGQNNGLGINGICPQAGIRISSQYIGNNQTNIVAAINAAKDFLGSGDIMLIEAQYDVGGILYPIEKASGVAGAINLALAKGIIVVEVAGNGGINIDTEIQTNAIIVGAGHPTELTWTEGTNYGNRIDLHGWGSNVVTAGKGDLHLGQNFPKESYTEIFDGTSAAGPMVAGAAALVQSIYSQANNGAKMDCNAMKQLLKSTGSLQGSGNPIGVRPNVVKALEQIGFTFVETEIEQVDETNSRFGEIEHYQLEQFIKYPVEMEAQTFWFTENSIQTIKADTDFKPETFQKFKTWSNLSILNHTSFEVQNPQPKLTAKFLNTENAEVTTMLISTDQFNKGDIKYKDPWLRINEDPAYLDDFGYRNLGMEEAQLETYTLQLLPLELSTSSDFMGVFLDQYPDPLNPDAPYYSVAAPEQEIDGVDYFLDSWTCSPAGSAEFEDTEAGTTAVIFRQPNAQVTANMKGHLATNNLNATAANNGRRISTDHIDNKSHMVYVDNGHIYYSCYSNASNEWSNEINLSKDAISGYTCYSPSIAHFIEAIEGETESKTIVGIVWEMTNGTANKMIAARVLDTAEGTWSNIFYETAQSTYEVQPVIAAAASPVGGGTPSFYVLYIWEFAPMFELWCTKIEGSDNLYNFTTSDILYTSEENRISNPSICADYDINKLFYCWEENFHVFFGQAAISSTGLNYNAVPEWNTTEIENGYFNQKPSIVYDSDQPSSAPAEKVHIMWECRHEEGDLVCRHYVLDPNSPASEGSIHQLSLYSQNLFKPSSGVYKIKPMGTLSSYPLFATTQSGSGGIYNFKFDGTRWNILRDTFYGTNPSINSFGSEMKQVYLTENQNLPHFISTNNVNVATENSENISFDKIEFRNKIIDFSEFSNFNMTGNASLKIGDLEVLGVNSTYTLNFETNSDSITAHEFQKTIPLAISAGMERLSLTYQINISDLNYSTSQTNVNVARLDIYEDNASVPAHNLFIYDLNNMSGSNYSISDTLEIDLLPFRNKTIHLNLLTCYQLHKNTAEKPSLISETVFVPKDEMNDFLNLTQSSGKIIPSAYYLHQNYPNPFNPTTTIKFDLPEQSPAKIVVYNLSGQKVKTLLNNSIPAGQHDIVWNGKDDNGQQVASGIYILQLTAGKHQFSKKMMLIK